MKIISKTLPLLLGMTVALTTGCSSNESMISAGDYSIDIVQSGIVVYSVDVDATTTSVELPSWLSGEYELQLHPDGSSYYFYGDITL